MGIYFSVIGFVLGVRVDAKTIDTIGFPVIILAAMTIIPFDTLGASGGFMDLVGKLQRAFPGYYYTKLIQDLTEKQTIDATSISALCCRIWIEFAIFLSARTQRENGELRAVKKALRTTQGFFFAIKTQWLSRAVAMKSALTALLTVLGKILLF